MISPQQPSNCIANWLFFNVNFFKKLREGNMVLIKIYSSDVKHPFESFQINENIFYGLQILKF